MSEPKLSGDVEDNWRKFSRHFALCL